VLTDWAHWSGQPEWAWPDQLGPADRPLTLSLTRSCSNPNPLWRSRIADDSLIWFRQDPASSTAVLWGNRSASSISSIWPWGFVDLTSIRHHRLRASPSGSCPRGSTCFGWPRWSFFPLLSACSGTSIASSVGRRACNPDVAPRCCAWPLGREHNAAPRHHSHWTVASLPQPWLRRWCRCHGLLPRSSVSSPVSSFLLLVSVLLSWWPGQRARHACLLLLCHTWACDAVLELLCWPLSTAAVSFSARFSYDLLSYICVIHLVCFSYDG
jgi:hypothetical protein